MKRRAFTNLVRKGLIGGGDVPFFTQFGVPSNAFSLRDLRGDDPNVIRVIRGADDVAAIFKASEVQAVTPILDFAGTSNLTMDIVYNQVDGGGDMNTGGKGNAPYIALKSGGDPIMQTINGKPSLNITGIRYIFTNSFLSTAINTTFKVFHPTGSTSYTFLRDTDETPVKRGYTSIENDTGTSFFANYNASSLAINSVVATPANRGALYTLVDDVKHGHNNI